MRVLAVKRHAQSYNDDPLIQKVYATQDRIEMISQCDYLVVAAPLTPETRGLVGEREFAAMKPDAVVINLGRGPVIDEKAMVQALAEKRIKGAALDVFDTEPLPAGHAFYGMENVLLSPHSADHTATWTRDAMLFFLAQFDRYTKGEPLENLVKKGLGY